MGFANLRRKPLIQLSQVLLPLVFAGITLLFAAAEAREAYLRDVPSPFGCTTCHDDPSQSRGAPLRNGFGFAYVFFDQQWAQFCALDSDNDGFSNAIELLDPECMWQPGDPIPIGEATHPGDGRDPDQCGDGVIQGSEECDGPLNLDVHCRSEGYADGFIECSDDCLLDDTNCIAEVMTGDASLPMHMDAMVLDMMIEADIELNPEPLDTATSSVEQTATQDIELVDDLRRDASSAFLDGTAGENVLPDSGMKNRTTRPEEFESEKTGCQAGATRFDFWKAMIFGIVFAGLWFTRFRRVS